VPANRVGIPRRAMSWSLKEVMGIGDTTDGATGWEDDGMSSGA